MLNNISRVFQESGVRPTALALAAACATASALLALAPALVAYLALSAYVAGQDGVRLYAFLALAAVAAMVLRHALSLAGGLLSHRVGNFVATALRERLLESLGRAGAWGLSHMSAGRVKKILSEDINQIDMLVSHHLPDLVSSVAAPLVIGAALLLLDWRMALAALAPLPLALWLQAGSARIARRDGIMSAYGTAQERMNNSISEFVKGMPVVKIYNRDMNACGRLRESVAGFRHVQGALVRKLSGRWGGFVALLGLSHVPLGVLGLWLHGQGQLHMAQLVLFLMLGPMVLGPLVKLTRIGAFLSQLDMIMANLDSLLLPGGGERGGVAEYLAPAQGGPPADSSLSATDLGFSYGGAEALCGVNLAIAAGSLVAVVGPSGSGKSTLAALLAGVEKPSCGSVRIGGRDVATMSQEELSATVAVFWQDAFIFTGTVRENIALGKPHASQEDIARAAAVARCHERILALPDGYDTVIGEGGTVQLSGGERQRVALARCILRDTPVLIMDEATSAMDAENERQIQQALSAAARGRTVVVITHRVQSVERADHIIVLKEGRVSGQGRHEELLRRDPTYAAMWAAHGAARRWRISGPLTQGGEAAA
ncbi:ATP-binding cassette, subfamily B [Humidesulfovibrio mexicanus]|uniref:ATP-binding cassette, subfamily B n=1 Tax=Humidesulfovibrio mexicanus TaxID=147047 RepID=A0A239BMC3_9BACT|nr:ABC transporter ATP-binding protein [Humidesulfovibrio mexicanus]SNS08498.1 ATP-binding cassette, subfamily B [Humidesulfovibrio mexicanus]